MFLARQIFSQPLTQSVQTLLASSLLSHTHKKLETQITVIEYLHKAADTGQQRSSYVLTVDILYRN